MKRVLIPLFALAISRVAFGGVIEGPTRVGVDKSAILRVPRQLAGSDYSWKVASEGISWIDGENRDHVYVVLLDLPAGTHVVSFASYEAKKHEIHVISAGNPPPPPPPNPPTPPPPDPGRFGLANSAAAWLVAHVDPSARTRARPLAEAFESVASMIGAGALRDAQSILAESKRRNGEAVGSDLERWRPWFVALQRELERLHREGKLATPNDYADAWREVASGLRRAAP